ncbi:MAG: DUF4279 domain-containing protein [Chloroflexota bacterium]
MTDNPNASQTWASIRFSGRNLDPEAVTRALGISPSTSFRRGQERATNKKWNHGHWGLTSEGNVSSTDLELHITWLVDQLLPVQDRLRDLLHSGDYEGKIMADIFCYWESATGNGGPGFSPELMGKLSSLGLSLELDIYFAPSAQLFDQPFLDPGHLID